MRKTLAVGFEKLEIKIKSITNSGRENVCRCGGRERVCAMRGG